MLEGRDLLIFGGDWDWFPSVLQQIAQQLVAKNRILWVGSVSIRRPRLQMYDLRRIIGRLFDPHSSHRHSSSGPLPTAAINPFVLPLYDLPVVRATNDALLRNVLRKRMKQLGFRDIIAFPSTPMVSGIMGQLGESSIHYFCVDDYSQYDGAYRCIPLLEKQLLSKADSCFAVSDPLLKTRTVKSGETHFLPMGVDTDHFRPFNEPPPGELASMRKPIVGFVGLLGSYVDLDLIMQCAIAYPRVSFVVIGRTMVDVSALSKAPNIHYLGEVAYEKVPQYARAFDVGLNPRIINQLTIAMNPLKIIEYLALGIPVVSTDLPAVRKFSDHVYVAHSREQFIELIDVALKEADQAKRDARRVIAEAHSWRSIARNVSEIVERIDRAGRPGSPAGTKTSEAGRS